MMEQTGSPARDYHEATKHRPGSASQRRLIDVELIPKQYKRYVGLPSLSLPSPSRDDGPLTLPALSDLLHFSNGIVQRRHVDGRDLEFRAASCTGALYHVELYLVCGAVDDVRAGVYHFDAPAESLHSLRAGDFRASVAAALDMEDAGAEAFVIFTTTFWRNAWRYQERAYRHAFWDAGTIAANLLALGRAHALQPRLHAGFLDDNLNYLLGLDSRREAAVCIVALGSGATYDAAPDVEALDLATEPLSNAEIEYPKIWQTHEATSLPHAPALRQWLDGTSPQEAAETPLTSEAIQDVIGRRGSSRRFRGDAITRPELAALIEAAIAPFPADFTSLTSTLAIVNNVEGVPAGAYRVDTTEGRLQRLQRANLQETAAHLALDQAAAGTAAVNFYFVTQLDEVLETLSDRGYRAAQLEGGVRGGRVYLKAAELGLKATGLTFYDDEVVDLFEESESAAVLFLIATGR